MPASPTDADFAALEAAWRALCEATLCLRRVTPLRLADPRHNLDAIEQASVELATVERHLGALEPLLGAPPRLPAVQARQRLHRAGEWLEAISWLDELEGLRRDLVAHHRSWSESGAAPPALPDLLPPGSWMQSIFGARGGRWAVRFFIAVGVFGAVLGILAAMMFGG